MSNQARLYTKEYFQKRDVLPQHLAVTLSLFLKNSLSTRILEVGCGTGKMVKYLKKAGFDIIGCDKSETACKISGQIKADATSLPFADKEFDAVLAISLIEHLTKQQAIRFLQETRRVLKKEGRLFIETPNLFSPMRIFKRKNWYGYSDPTHTVLYTPSGLATLLKQAGFNHFRFWFSIPKKPSFNCPFFNLAGKFPRLITDFISYLLISTPLALIRDGIWLGAKKSIIK